MTPDVVDRRIRAMLRDEAGPASRDYLGEVMADVGRTRQRRSWVIRERWLPMDLPLTRPAVAPRLRPLLIATAVVALLVAGLLLAGQRPHLPPPFGLAANGDISIAIDGRIVLIGPDGRNRRALDTPAPDASTPVFSPDGSRMAFWTRTAADGPLDLWVARADGSRPLRVNGDQPIIGDPFHLPWWSPGGTQLVVASGGRLHIVEADGSRVRPLGPGEGIRGLTPRWSPDASWIAFVAGVTDGSPPRLAIAHPDGSGYQELPTSSGSDFAFQAPSWATDSRRLLYDFGGDDGHDVGFIDIVSGVETVVSADPEDEFWPVWSPDDSQIAWNTSSKVIRVVRPDGTGDVAIEGSGIDSDPAWSPDGTFILGLDPGQGRLVVARSDGTGEPTFIPLEGTPDGWFTWQRAPLP